MTNFIPGLRLSAEFFQEAVAPILAADFRSVPYSAAIIGKGHALLALKKPGDAMSILADKI